MVRGQLSTEFAIIFVTIILASLITIAKFSTSVGSDEEVTLDKVDAAGKTAVALVNAKYNGINANTTLIYCGMNWSEDKKNIIIYIKPKDINGSIKEFIINYIYNKTKINRTEYNITIG
jgi:uncharacterized protein (UPF0333 family)